MRIIMVDWSGRKSGAEKAIALAEVRSGVLVRVEKGRSRNEVLDELRRMMRDGLETFIGLDFAFSLPAWFLEQRGWCVDDLWAFDTEQWLVSCEAPFWGRPGIRKPAGGDDFHYRRTDQDVVVNGIRPKSVFQIGGAGSVGSGSLRGFWILPELRQAGATIWPFEAASEVTVAEVYPRAFTGAVVKGDAACRTAHLRLQAGVSRSKCIEQVMIDDEDCFDAGCTAMALWQFRDRIGGLAKAHDRRTMLEGTIVTPEVLRASKNA